MTKKIIIILASMVLFFGLSMAAPSHVISAAKQQQLTPEQALQKLIEGNERYVQENLRDINHEMVLKKITAGQHPFAFILSCIDSRSVPEILFDQALGNMFVGRVAGNVVGKNMLGSMEFATKVSGARVIVVMGHSACGAIVGACNHVEVGNLTHLLREIQPAVSIVKKDEGKTFNCESTKTIHAITKQNVLDQMHVILMRSSIIANLVKEKKIMLVGAMHNLANGKVNFFNLDGKAVN